jgi:hypothetical protein
MTEDDVRENMNQLVKVKASGTQQQYQEVRIVDYEPNQNSPWGKGVVTVEFPHEPNRERVRHSIEQLELYIPHKKLKRRKRKGKIS